MVKGFPVVKADASPILLQSTVIQAREPWGWVTVQVMPDAQKPMLASSLSTKLKRVDCLLCARSYGPACLDK